jgi:hypothetical protein
MSTEAIIEEQVPKLVAVASKAESTGVYIPKVRLNQAALLGAVALVGASFAAYKVAVKRTTATYEDILEQELALSKKFYSTLYKKDEMATPEQALSELHPDEEGLETMQAAVQAIHMYKGEDVHDISEFEEVNVFTNTPELDDNFDLQEEKAIRDRSRPYVIAKGEFLETFDNFEQLNLTYYSGDSTLADDKDQPIPNVGEVVGDDNIQRFGHGSGDPSVVYVRNEAKEMDFEVLWSPGKYAHEVLGFEHAEGGERARKQQNQPRKYKDAVNEHPS